MNEKILKKTFSVFVFFRILLIFSIVYGIFQIIFFIGNFPAKTIEKFFHLLSLQAHQYVKNEFFLSLLTQGILPGIGSVFIFLPYLLILFFFFSFLEETNLMQRLAYYLNPFLKKIGLSSESFISLLLGFGCTVTAIFSTRSIQDPKMKKRILFILPLMVCGTKFVLFSTLIAAFFSPEKRAPLLFSLYIIGILSAFLLLKIFNIPLDKEIVYPPLKKPNLKRIVKKNLCKTKNFIKKLGSTLLLFSVLFWFLTNFPKNREKIDKLEQQKIELINSGMEKETINLYREKQKEILKDSFIGYFGKKTENLFAPLGFDWKLTTCLFSSFAFKEMFLSHLSILFAAEENNPVFLQEKLTQSYSPLQAFCLMTFLLLSIPCIGTIIAIKKETRSWKMTACQMLFLFTYAYLFTLILYQIGKCL